MYGRQLGVYYVGAGFFVGCDVVVALWYFPVERHFVPVRAFQDVFPTFCVFGDRFVEDGRTAAYPRFGARVAWDRAAFRARIASDQANVFRRRSDDAANYRLERRVRDRIFHHRSFARFAVGDSARNFQAELWSAL